MSTAPRSPHSGALGASVIDLLGAKGVHVDTIRLPALRGEAPATGGSPVEGRAGPYEVLGEITAGGVGRILLGRDPDLGRDVAIKVLHREFARDETIVQRFVEEAQIGGQLQHPGVVPVYDQGTDAQGLPFFAMKLVKGRTLSALLGTRKNPQQNLRRFLTIFEQVCQCVAYAHARGVIHRDLKPANVMVGRFGEALVLDWGFAKVLAQGGVADERRAKRARRNLTTIATVRSSADGSASRAGSLMGTPGYMPPEQALGHVDELDERADVFALGAILCEILTGLPAFPEEPGRAMRRAREGDMAETVERLRRCGAEPRLIALAIECMAPLRRDRPHDAGALTRAIEQYLASGEERARQAKLDQVQAHAAARKSRAAALNAQRKRRQTVGLAISVVLAVTLGSVGLILWTQDAAERERKMHHAVAQALSEATLHESRGELDEAAADAGRATELAATHLPDLAERASRLRRRVEERAAREEAEHQEREKAERTAAELDRIRRQYWRVENLAAVEPDLLATFVSNGVDVRSADSSAIAIRVRGHRAATDLIAALDDWGAACLSDRPQEGARLLEVADMADGDPWRRRVRAAMIARDAEQLRAMTEWTVAREQPAESLRLLALGLLTFDASDAAVELLDQAQPRHPSDFWIARTLAVLHSKAERPILAARYNTVALALRPQDEFLQEEIDDALEKAKPDGTVR